MCYKFMNTFCQESFYFACTSRPKFKSFFPAKWKTFISLLKRVLNKCFSSYYQMAGYYPLTGSYLIVRSFWSNSLRRDWLNGRIAEAGLFCTLHKKYAINLSMINLFLSHSIYISRVSAEFSSLLKNRKIVLDMKYIFYKI